MRIILFVTGLLLITVNADTASGLKKDLKNALEQTKLLILRGRIKASYSLNQKIVESKVADQEYIEDCQRVLNKWPFQNESWVPDKEECLECLEDISELIEDIPEEEIKTRLDEYSKGSYSVIESKFKELRAQWFTEFENSATKIIRDAKEAGSVDHKFEELFNNFVQSNPENRVKTFTDIDNYLDSMINKSSRKL